MPRIAGKLYALHELEVDCRSKAKARVRYEFGCKVSIATMLVGGFVVGMRSMPGNPYDGHALPDVLQQVETLIGSCPSLAVVDRSYRGHGADGTTVLGSGMRRGLTSRLHRLLRRCSAIKPEFGHMIFDERLARCALKGTISDAHPRRALRLRAQHPKDPRRPQGPSTRSHRQPHSTIRPARPPHGYSPSGLTMLLKAD